MSSVSASAWEAVTMSLASALLIFWLTVMLRYLTKVNVHRISQTAIGSLRACLKKWDQRVASASDSFASFMAGKIMLKRLRNARIVNSFFCLVCTFVILYNGFAAFQGSRSYDLETQIAHDVVVFLTTFITLVNHFIPASMNRRTLPIWHSVLFFLFFVFGVLMAKNLSAEWFVLNGPRMLFCRLIFGLYYSALAPAIFWNVLYSLFTSIIVVSRPSDYRSELGVIALCSLEVIDCVLVIVLTKIFEFLQVSGVCSEIEAQSSSRSQETAERLLSAVCDAVVNLGPHLEILYSCPKLDAILFRKEDPKAFECQSFDAAVHDCDRKRFSQFLQSVGTESEASSLHLCLCDSYGRQIPVQIFAVSFYDNQERLCYIMGIKEQAEVFQIPPLASGDSTGMLVHVKEEASRNVKLTDSVSDLSNNDISEARMSVDSSATIESLADSSGVWFNLDPFLFVVTEVSPALTAIAGPSLVGADLEAWISNTEAFQSFTRFVQNMVNIQMNGSTMSSASAKEYGQFKFMPLRGVKCRAQCAVKLLQMSEEDVSVQVVLSNVRVGGCRKPSSRRQNMSASWRNHARFPL